MYIVDSFRRRKPQNNETHVRHVEINCLTIVVFRLFRVHVHSINLHNWLCDFSVMQYDKSWL
jgi:hypothetical protein